MRGFPSRLSVTRPRPPVRFPTQRLQLVYAPVYRIRADDDAGGAPKSGEHSGGYTENDGHHEAPLRLGRATHRVHQPSQEETRSKASPAGELSDAVMRLNITETLPSRAGLEPALLAEARTCHVRPRAIARRRLDEAAGSCRSSEYWWSAMTQVFGRLSHVG